jgi:phage shock protein PspC (stress-responsive transcriptional regulator)
MASTLYRDRSNKVVAGVCAGLGKYFGIDPILFRAIFLIILFVGGGGFFLYCILWVTIPQSVPFYQAPQSDFEARNAHVTEDKSSATESNVAMGLLLLSAGILLLVNNLVPDFNFKKFWPLILIIVGGGLIIGRKSKQNETQDNS